MLNNDYFLHCSFEKKISVCFHKQKQIEGKNKQTSYMSTFQISNFQCRTWFFLHECMKNKRYFQNSFLYLNINWYLNSNRVLTKIWGRIEFQLSSNRVLQRVEKQIPFLHSYILYYCFNLIANESFDELCNTFRIRKKKKCKTHNFFCVKLPKLFSCDFLHVHFYNPNFFLLCNCNCCF